MSIITLTTDFGTRDWFVGTMKGVILGIAPKAQVIDLTHEIPPGDVQAGAFALAAAFAYFPPGTIHLVVVDPGVGGSRAALVVQTRHYAFVGPDNGVLSLALDRDQIQGIRRLENLRYFLQAPSRTFHGRDIFAPVAAHLSSGVPLKAFGPAVPACQRLTLPNPVLVRGRWGGAVVYVDRFGNAITNLGAETSGGSGSSGRVQIRGRKGPIPIRSHYGAVPPGRPVAVWGSTGFLEIAVNGQSAAERLGLACGNPVWLTIHL
jgi:S-adenosyl-L-methionine hydrolase (adenosine-forming)